MSSEPRGVILSVTPDSPAYDAGLEPGMQITSVDGVPIRDLIDIMWLADDECAEFGYIDLDGDAGTVELWREPGEDWGFHFENPVFDGVKTCRNACIFCFMRQLPEGSRSSLSLRDDDWRLSFISGTFVTLTNLGEEDIQRIIEQHVSPLRVSLHATDADVRKEMIGKHAAVGLSNLERLLGAGIDFDAQIVLVPGMNDGKVLEQTLDWAYERPGIMNVGIVPLGFTRHQRGFEKSFENPEDALAVLKSVERMQRRALSERGHLWVWCADELYCSAYGEEVLDHLPSSEEYGSFPMFEDGIGIVRSMADEFAEAVTSEIAHDAAASLERERVVARQVMGFAMKPYASRMLLKSPLSHVLLPLFVENRYFGGNVNVTGLLSGIDIAEAIREDDSQSNAIYLLPDVLFNSNELTLDGMSIEELRQAAGTDQVFIVGDSPSACIADICNICASNA